MGTQLMNELLKKGEKIRCLDIYKPRSLPEGVEFIQGDLLAPAVLKKACADIDTIFHFLDIPDKVKQPRRIMKKINITGTRNLLMMAEKTGVKNIHFLSSYAVYGKKKNIPVRFSDERKPKTAYGKDKLKCEKLCELYQKKDINITIYRPSIIAGPKVDDPIILVMLYMALGMDDANRMYITDNGSSRFQLLDIDDAISAFLLAYEKNLTGLRIYNLGSDNVPTQLEQVVKLKESAHLDFTVKHMSSFTAKLLSFIFKPLRFTWLNKDHVFYLTNNILMDCQEAKTQLGWQPAKDNIETLTNMIDWYKKEKL